jgi:hypothetical protein
MSDTIEEFSQLSGQEKKLYLISNVSKLNYEDRIHLLGVIKQHVSDDLIKENRDGSRINLDKLHDNLINKLYHIVISKLNISTLSEL